MLASYPASKHANVRSSCVHAGASTVLWNAPWLNEPDFRGRMCLDAIKYKKHYSLRVCAYRYHFPQLARKRWKKLALVPPG